MRLRTVKSRLRASVFNLSEKEQIYDIMRGITDKSTVVGANHNKDWVNALKSVPDSARHIEWNSLRELEDYLKT